MDIIKLGIRNFLTIDYAEVELSNRGLLLIQGKNLDDTSADSNGAGKSSIADAICWALYGVTARGVSGDAVVNKTAKKDCWVNVYLKDGEETYDVTRFRKDSALKNQTTILDKSEVPLHKATERETQDVINSIVGCSLEVFQAAVYAGQEKMPDLPGMTDKQLKLMIEEAAGVEILANAYAVANARSTAKIKELSVVQNGYKMAAEAILKASTKLAETVTAYDVFEAERKPKAKEALSKALPYKARVDELKRTIAEHSTEETIKGELDEIAKQFEKLEAERTELAKLQRGANTLDRSLAAEIALTKGFKGAYEESIENLANIDKKVGTPCFECGKKYCEHDMEEAKRLAAEVVEQRKKGLSVRAIELRDLKARASEAQERATKFEASLTDTTKLASAQKEMNAKLSRLRYLHDELAHNAMELEKGKSAAKLLLEKDNPYTSIKEHCHKEHQAAIETVKDFEKRIPEHETEVEIAESVKAVFGPAGVRAHILDTVTPFLNDRTAHYLSTLADGNIRATWNTLTANAKGELKEKFSIEVSNSKGSESFAGLSGGEKRKVRLACAMALQDMVASRATKPINIFIADEVDHALDESGLERLMTVLNEKARERGTVLVISHNSLSDWIDEVITVTKEGGYAKVSGATS